MLIEDEAIVKIVATLDDQGAVNEPYRDFDTSSIASLTIWPYEVEGERSRRGHLVWWVTHEVFRAEHRPWAEAFRDG